MNKKRPIQYLQDVYSLAGSSTDLAAALKLHTYTVENWRRSGIPQKYWARLEELYGITPAELHHVWRQCRKATTSPSHVK